MEEDNRVNPQTLVICLREQIQKEIHELHSEICRIKKESHSYKLLAERKLEARSTSNAKLRSTLRKREADYKHIYERLLEVSNQNRIIAENNHKLYIAKEELETKISRLEQSKSDQNEEFFSDNNNFSTVDIEDLQITIAQLTLEKDVVEQKLREKSTEYEELAKNCTEMETNLCKLLTQNQQLITDIGEKETELENLKMKFVSLSDQLCKETSLNQQENVELSNKLIKLEKNQTTLEKKVAEERERNENLQHKIKYFKQKKCESNHALQEESVEETGLCEKFRGGEVPNVEDQSHTMLDMDTSFMGGNENLFQSEGVSEASYNLRIIEKQAKHCESSSGFTPEMKRSASQRRFDKVSKFLFGKVKRKTYRHIHRLNPTIVYNDSNTIDDAEECSQQVSICNTPVAEIQIVTLSDSENEFENE